MALGLKWEVHWWNFCWNFWNWMKLDELFGEMDEWEEFSHWDDNDELFQWWVSMEVSKFLLFGEFDLIGNFIWVEFGLGNCWLVLCGLLCWIFFGWKRRRRYEWKWASYKCDLYLSLGIGFSMNGLSSKAIRLSHKCFRINDLLFSDLSISFTEFSLDVQL